MQALSVSENARMLRLCMCVFFFTITPVRGCGSSTDR